MKRFSSILLLAILAPTVLGAGRPEYKITRNDIEKLPSAMQETFAGLQYILNPHQIRQFLSLQDDGEREKWLAVFWMSQDPTPTTRKNEMFVEHSIRVKLARQFFKSSKWPGWDKRGEVFIRYGPPDYRGKIWGEVTAKRMRPPGELWYYRRHNMLVSFQNFGLKGEYIYSIEPLGAAENLSPDLAEFLLYDTSQSLASKIPQNLLELYASPPSVEAPTFVDPTREANFKLSSPRHLPEEIDAIMDPDRSGMIPKDISSLFHKDQIRRVANNFEIVLEETPASYPFNFEEKALPFYFGIDQFKAGDSVNRVECNIEIPIVSERGAADEGERVFEAEVVVWDPEYHELTRKTREIVLRTGPDAAPTANLIPTQTVMTLSRGYYRIAVSVRDKNSKRSSAYRTTFSCAPFSGPLILSDILFASRIRHSENQTSFTRGPLEVVPHPLRAYSRGFPIPIYFEIYNLTLNERGTSAYGVEYKIVPHNPKKSRFWERYRDTAPVVSSKFEASGYGADETQHLVIRTENLDAGSYDFLVTVSDQARATVAYRKGTFSIVE